MRVTFKRELDARSVTVYTLTDMAHGVFIVGIAIRHFVP